MKACHEKHLQHLVILFTVAFGVFGIQFLPAECMYSLAVVAGPFLAGFVFVLLTRRSRRDAPSSVTLSVVGSVGLGVIGLAASHSMEQAQPYAAIEWCRDFFWAALGDGAYFLLLAVCFVAVPIGCFIAGRVLADRWLNTMETTD